MKIKIFGGTVVPSQMDNILKFNQYMKSDICWHWIFDLKKIDGCVNNPEISSTTKIGEHVPSRYPMPTILAFAHVENKHSLYWSKIVWRKFCTAFR